MANYSAAQTFIYSNQNGFPVLGPPGEAVAIDSENDDSFEVGDTEQIIFEPPAGRPPITVDAQFVGTITVNGNEYPVFEDLRSYFLLDSNPSTIGTPPATLTASDITAQDFAFCFLAGTMVATPSGEVAVEALGIGDPILTADGRTVPVRWVGRQTVFPAFAPERMLPVRIERGALDGVADAVEGSTGPVPHRDLIVTADHGMMIAGPDGQGVVVNASALVNGTTIRFVEASELPQSVIYYHVETADHDAIVAEGAPAETFIDYRSRQTFDNYAEYEALYGTERIVPEMARPRVSSQRLLPDHVRAQLNIAENRTAEAMLDDAFEMAGKGTFAARAA